MTTNIYWKMLNTIIERVLAKDPVIRYVAVYHEGQLASQARSGLSGASASESDKYEELIVNPTLLKLVQQRGNIDCGGMQYVVIRYGNFYEIVIPRRAGHLSVGVEASADPVALVPSLLKMADEGGI